MDGCFAWVDTHTTFDTGVKLTDRKERRNDKRMFNILLRKAKQDMADWVISLNRMPSKAEILAFQAGYISGMDRGANDKDVTS